MHLFYQLATFIFGNTEFVTEINLNDEPAIS
ncbi:MAG: hypothetical protein JWP81_2029 [Ferruginibacter sp.]|nr:hypothetical protein [Ferruginibacter sp.]